MLYEILHLTDWSLVHASLTPTSHDYLHRPINRFPMLRRIMSLAHKKKENWAKKMMYETSKPNVVMLLC